MSESLHYSRAPITEALIDIQVEPLPTSLLGTLLALHKSEEQNYPNRANSFIFEGQIVGGEQIGATAKQTQIGYTFASTNKPQVFQVRLNGFTFNRLAPYEHWGSFRDEAQRLWKAYRSAVQPVRITRVAVRYINRLDLPAPAELSDYLQTYPEIAADIPQSLNGYFMRVELPLTDLPGMLVITQTISPPPAPGISSIILDIDIYRNDETVPQDEVEIWSFFEELRNQKNHAFQSCITERTKELIS